MTDPITREALEADIVRLLDVAQEYDAMSGRTSRHEAEKAVKRLSVYVEGVTPTRSLLRALALVDEAQRVSRDALTAREEAEAALGAIAALAPTDRFVEGTPDSDKPRQIAVRLTTAIRIASDALDEPDAARAVKGDAL